MREQAQAEAAAIVAAAHADAARLADEAARAQQAQQEADALLAAARLEAAQIRGAAVASAPPPPPPQHTSVAAAVQVRETVVVRHMGLLQAFLRMRIWYYHFKCRNT